MKTLVRPLLYVGLGTMVIVVIVSVIFDTFFPILLFLTAGGVLAGLAGLVYYVNSKQPQRMKILINPLLFGFGTMVIVFIGSYMFGGYTYPVWLFLIAGGVLAGLIYYVDSRILPRKSSQTNQIPGSSVFLISAVALALGVGIPASITTIMLVVDPNPASFAVIITGPTALFCVVGAIILLKRLVKMFFA